MGGAGAAGRFGMTHPIHTLRPTRRQRFSLEPTATALDARRTLAATARKAGRGAPEVVVDIDDEIDADMASRVEAQLREAVGARRVVLVIDSIGGDVDAAKRIHAAVRRHPAEKRQALITGKCHSAAVLIAVAADFRSALPDASILLHRTARDPQDRARWTADTYASHAAALKRIDDDLLDVLAERTGAPRAALEREEQDDRETPLMKAVGLGIIHEIQGVRPFTPRPLQLREMSDSPRTMFAIIGAPSVYASDAYAAACRAAPDFGGER